MGDCHNQSAVTAPRTPTDLVVVSGPDPAGVAAGLGTAVVRSRALDPSGCRSPAPNPANNPQPPERFRQPHWAERGSVGHRVPQTNLGRRLEGRAGLGPCGTG